MKQSGYLTITDISGYTAFLTQSELEHAHQILEELFQNLLDSIDLPLVVAKLEGDAIFCYARQGSFIKGQTMLEGIEKLYNAFANHREIMRLNTTCPCTACRLIPTLDLKFAVHYGDYMIGRGDELTGADVIVVHRLLKNTVIETINVKAYVFFTDAAAQQMALSTLTSDLIEHTETYDHIGDVKGYVYDLQPVWKRYQEKSRIRVEQAEAWLYNETIVPAPPALVWDYLTTPNLQERWMGVHIVGAQGRTGAGSVSHCAHGKMLFDLIYVDWQPFDYFTIDGPWMLGVRGYSNFSLTPVEGGTQITYSERLYQQPGLRDALARPIIQYGAKAMFNHNSRSQLKKLKAIIEEESAARKPLTPALTSEFVELTPVN